MRLVTAAVGTFIGVLDTTLHAQDLEPAYDDDLSRAACFVQKSGIQLRSEHARTVRFSGYGT
jgi:hypothetical protein